MQTPLENSFDFEMVFQELCGPVRAELVFWPFIRGLSPAGIRVFATPWQEYYQNAEWIGSFGARP